MSEHPVEYRVAVTRPEAHLFDVQIRLEDPVPQGQVFSMSAWIPGSYMVRDFVRHVGCLKARCGDRELALTKLDKQTWQCEPCDGPLELSYEVYAWDLSVRAAHLDITHGYFNGTSLFMRLHERDQRECRLHLSPPEKVQGDWKVSTAMPLKGAERYGFGEYRCADFDELVDHPVEMGDFTLASFEACGVQHDIVLTGRHQADMERLCRDLKTICEHHIRFFGEPAPMDYYVFQVMVVGDGYGGLEHRASTSLLCSRNDLPAADMSGTTDAYRQFLGLCSHEYFHTWNVKRIKPAQYLPYDLSSESHTELMWVFEGFTSYYDDLGVLRCGLISPEEYLQGLGQIMTRVWRSSGRFKQSVAESSFDTWTRFYQQDENAPNAIVSYYTKGALLALSLDLTLRLESNGRYSLDDVMQALWQRYGQPLVGLGENDMPVLIHEITGIEVGSLLDRCLYGTEDVPLEQLLPQFGVSFNLRPSASSKDKGGMPDTEAEKARPLLGARVVDDHGEARLAAVFDDGAAQAAGMSAADKVIAVNGLRVSSANLESRVAAADVGACLEVHAFRRDELMVFQLPLMAPKKDTCYLQLIEDDEAAADRRRQWMGLG